MAIKRREAPKTALEAAYQKFWQAFNDATKRDEAFILKFKPHPYGSIRSYQDYAIGEPYHIVVGINFKKHEIRVAAYFHDVDAYAFYYQNNKALIEECIGKRQKWARHKTKGSATLIDSTDFDETHGWENAFQVMISNMLKVLNAFVIVPPKPKNDL